MTRIEDIKRLEFTITWEIIRLGWIGPGDFLKQLSVEEINTFACCMINEASVNNLGEIAELCATRNEQLITEILSKLSPEINERTERIWRAVLLQETMNSLPADPLYGMIGLTDFWLQFGYPVDSPHEMQGVGNDISPTDYYTHNNFEKTLNNHRGWLEKEINELIEF